MEILIYIQPSFLGLDRIVEVMNENVYFLRLCHGPYIFHYIVDKFNLLYQRVCTYSIAPDNFCLKYLLDTIIDYQQR